VDKRIQTLFLNGKAIDNRTPPFSKKTRPLPFSAAMPGGPGATCVREALRSNAGEISYQRRNTGILSMKALFF